MEKKKISIYKIFYGATILCYVLYSFDVFNFTASEGVILTLLSLGFVTQGIDIKNEKGSKAYVITGIVLFVLAIIVFVGEFFL